MLIFRNGASESSPLIGKYCGNTIPKEIPSHTNYLYLFFKSDISHEESGFKIDWDSAATGKIFNSGGKEGSFNVFL